MALVGLHYLASVQSCTMMASFAHAEEPKLFYTVCGYFYRKTIFFGDADFQLRIVCLVAPSLHAVEIPTKLLHEDSKLF